MTGASVFAPDTRVTEKRKHREDRTTIYQKRRPRAGLDHLRAKGQNRQLQGENGAAFRVQRGAFCTDRAAVHTGGQNDRFLLVRSGRRGAGSAVRRADFCNARHFVRQNESACGARHVYGRGDRGRAAALPRTQRKTQRSARCAVPAVPVFV